MPAKEYILALCRRSDKGEILPFESKTIEADDDKKAIAWAHAWAVPHLGQAQFEQVWLQVNQDGKCVWSKDIVPFT